MRGVGLKAKRAVRKDIRLRGAAFEPRLAATTVSTLADICIHIYI
jgi:hypothetical protein